MNKIKEFFNEKFGIVRTVEVHGVTYFVATDVARILGYKNPQKAIRDHCKGGERNVHTFKRWRAECKDNKQV